MLRRADAVTTICEGLRSEIVGRGISPEKVTVIPNAVDLEQFEMKSAGEKGLEAGIGLSGKRVLGFIGSFYAYEGLSLLLEACPAIAKQVPNAHVLLVGGGPEETRLKAFASDLDIEGMVTFTGRVPHERVQAYYDLIDVFVYPRRSMRLTELVTPLKPLEAMARGRPVIASDVGGHRELIRHGETGTLFRADDVNALLAAVVELLGDEARWHGLRAAGRRFVESDRNWAAATLPYAAVYEAARQRVR